MWLAYRLQLYEPRSVDATETTLLTPVPGAAHNDPFDVATITGVTNVQPYLQLPDGQNGALDPVAKDTTIGTRVVSVGDKTITGNAVRWATAFLGDATGRNRLKGCKAVLSEQTTAGGAWTAIFTGRVGNVKLDGKLKLSLELKSSADDLKRKIFVYDPLPSASYAFRAALMPPRLPKSWGSGTLPAGDWIKGHTAGKYQATGSDNIWRARITLDAGQDLQRLTMMTKQSFPFFCHATPALAVVNNGGTIGAFRIDVLQSDITSFLTAARVRRECLTDDVAWLRELPAAHPLYMALPADGTAVTFYLAAIDTTPVDASHPIFIDDVHPIQLWADILDGNFSIANTDYTARPIAPRDTSAAGPWDYTNPLSVNYSLSDLPKVRFIVTGPARADYWIRDNILQPFNLGYRTDGAGRVVPLDLRVSSSTAVSGSIGDSDCVELPTDWTVDGSTALFGADLTYYVDQAGQSADLIASTEILPDVAANLVSSAEEHVLITNPHATARDAGDQITTIDAKGIRLTKDEFSTSDPGQLLAIDKLAKSKVAMYQLLAPFAGGSVTIPLKLTRASAFGTSGAPGQFWTIQVSTIPDPATNQRGGARVGLCLSRTNRGLSVLATFLDVGSATAAAVPTVGTLAITNGGLDVPITVNASSDPVEVEYIVTKAGTGSRPSPNDAGWTLIGIPLTASGGVRQNSVPSNTRLWVRARSRPSGSGLKLPSAYVFPAGGAPAGSIDVAALSTPGAVSHTTLWGNVVDLSWTNTDTTDAIEVYLTTGGVPAAWTAAMRQFTLQAGSTGPIRLGSLALSTQYTAAVCYVDKAGGRSAFSTHTFTTIGTAKTAPPPPYVWVIPQPAEPRTIDPKRYI